MVAFGFFIAVAEPAIAGPRDGPRCRSSEDCDDGLFCNGREQCRCEPGSPGCSARRCTAGLPPVCNDSNECTNDRCDDETAACVNAPRDVDGDGHGDGACGGDDCDDGDALRFPGNPEVCDASHDEDCDPETFGPDADGDGFVDASCCNGGTCGTDCNDGAAAVHPATTDICNSQDEDCDGLIDEDQLVTVYADEDLDGFGDGEAIPDQCPRAGRSVLDNDCDDTNPAIHPGEMICQTESAVQVCQSDGTWTKAVTCRGPCVTQPNATGFCLPQTSPPDPI